jgi:hypothetical protein
MSSAGSGGSSDEQQMTLPIYVQYEMSNLVI